MEVTKEFLEAALGRKIESFSIQKRPDTGDNYMSALVNLDVVVKSEDKGSSETETLKLISKFFPNNEGRQAYISAMGMFWKEIGFYKAYLPEVLKFTQELGLKDTFKLDIPNLIAGDAKNYSDGNSNQGKKLIGPCDNYVMMVDVCRTYDFKLADRHVRFDIDHLLLAAEAIAKFHALSWAYKTQKKIDINEKFPSMVFDYNKGRGAYEGLTAMTINEAIEMLKSEVDPHILASLSNFKQHSNKILEAIYCESAEPEEEITKCFRIKPKEVPESTEVPWRVVIHGDFQLTNMLFRYNPVTNKPEEVLLIDFQTSRVLCPTIDLAYFMYTSTFLETREKHSDEFLERYHEKFNYFCKMFQTETLPGFTLKELKRRYQRSKVFGFIMGLMIAPIMLKEKENTVQLDSVKKNQTEILETVAKGIGGSSRIKQNVILLLKEFYDEGII